MRIRCAFGMRDAYLQEWRCINRREMKAAFAHWDDRIAPVFDSARQLRMVDVVNGEIISETDERLVAELPVQKALRLAELGVGTLVCGAISRTLYELICAYEIRVLPFVAGELNAVIEAWIRGDLDRDVFTMPGCYGRDPGRFRTGRKLGQFAKEDAVMNPGGMGRGGGGGMGRGGGGMGQGGGGGRGQGGRGRGRKAGPLAGGPLGYCVCPSCGHRVPHERGVPCMGQKCPNCNAPMVRED